MKRGLLICIFPEPTNFTKYSTGTLSKLTTVVYLTSHNEISPESCLQKQPKTTLNVIADRKILVLQKETV